jgi:hypothetical protein
MRLSILIAVFIVARFAGKWLYKANRNAQEKEKLSGLPCVQDLPLSDRLGIGQKLVGMMLAIMFPFILWYLWTLARDPDLQHTSSWLVAISFLVSMTVATIVGNVSRKRLVESAWKRNQQKLVVGPVPDVGVNRAVLKTALFVVGIVVVCGILGGVILPARLNSFSSLRWVHGPTLAKVGTEAELNLGQGLVFLESSDIKKFLIWSGRGVSPKVVSVAAPENFAWWAVFKFDEIGYVEDRGRDALDADIMLTSVRRSTEDYGDRHKLRTLSVVGWIEPPHYDEATHNLQWMLKDQDQKGGIMTDYNTVYLGRRGTMTVELLASRGVFESSLAPFKELLHGFSFMSGHEYRAHADGDRTAERGLADLVLAATPLSQGPR